MPFTPTRSVRQAALFHRPIDPEHPSAALADTRNLAQSRTMNTYNVKIRYEDRKNGTEGSTVKVDATTIAGAIAKACRKFVKGLDRKQRFDANKGLTAEAVRVTTDKADATETPENPAAAGAATSS